jgi:hypothetical protein
MNPTDISRNPATMARRSPIRGTTIPVSTPITSTVITPTNVSDQPLSDGPQSNLCCT